MAKAEVTAILNVGAMSDFIGAFDVPSKVTDYVYRCRFSHCWNGIATRHADTMDCKFFVDGKGVVLGLAHPGFVEFQGSRGSKFERSRSQLHRGRIFARAAGAGRRTLALRCFHRGRGAHHSETRHSLRASSCRNLSRCSCYEPGGLDEAAVPFFANERT